MSRDVGVVRDAAGLASAGVTLADLQPLGDELPARAVSSYEVRNVLRVARGIVAAAIARDESRGAHYRSDHPDLDDARLGRFVLVGGRAPQYVASRALVERGS
jgi:L-aspartate oxidase